MITVILSAFGSKVIGYEQDDRGSISGRGMDIFHHHHFGLTEPSMKWVPVSFPGD